LALDTEFVREKTYFPNLCLVQVATESISACVDPLKISSLDPLLDLIYQPGRIKVLHAASQDFEILYWLRGVLPNPVFDTQIAAAALGLGEQCSYAALVERRLETTLPKTQTRTDWSIRPLSAAQLDYAADDVIYLARLYSGLRDELERRGRLSWVEEECLSLSDPASYAPEGRVNWRKVPGASDMGAHHLVVLRALALWRERQAFQDNRPRQWILSDGSLAAIATNLPETEAGLMACAMDSGAYLRRHADTLLQVVALALHEPEANWPAAYLRPSREETARVQGVMQRVRELAGRHELAPSLLATRSEIESLVRGEGRARLLGGWRKELLAEDLDHLLDASPA
jgi:ribonuclease D